MAKAKYKLLVTQVELLQGEHSLFVDYAPGSKTFALMTDPMGEDEQCIVVTKDLLHGAIAAIEEMELVEKGDY